MIRIVIADDHPLLRAALREAVAVQLHDADVKEAASVAELVELLEDGSEFDAVLLDLNMPDANGFSALVRLRGQFPEVPVIIVSATEDTTAVDRALLLGASGYIVKSAPIDQVGADVRSVLSGNQIRPRQRSAHSPLNAAEVDQFRRIGTLTPQQLNVLIMIAAGDNNKTVANRLKITEATVKAHITSVLMKLGVQSRTQAAVLAQRALNLGGVIPFSDLPEDELT